MAVMTITRGISAAGTANSKHRLGRAVTVAVAAGGVAGAVEARA